MVTKMVQNAMMKMCLVSAPIKIYNSNVEGAVLRQIAEDVINTRKHELVLELNAILREVASNGHFSVTIKIYKSDDDEDDNDSCEQMFNELHHEFLSSALHQTQLQEHYGERDINCTVRCQGLNDNPGLCYLLTFCW